jgi:flagellar protein FlgJ
MAREGLIAGVYTDFQGLGKLRAEAAKDEKSAQREVAQQFEALFIESMLKSMRTASFGDSLTGSDQADMYRDMMDHQLAINLSQSGGIGMADIIERQLGGVGETKGKTASPDAIDESLAFASRLWRGVSPYANNTAISPLQVDKPWNDPQSFIERLRPAAEAAARSLGTQPEAVLAIAALETGWGKHVMPASNGQSSFNLFGIKATRDWNNGRVMANTLEFESGRMQQRREPFRTYHSPDESVADFARFIRGNPRYGEALQAGADPQRFIEKIHEAGYATDPDYVSKVGNVMRQIQGMTQASAEAADNST